MTSKGQAVKAAFLLEDNRVIRLSALFGDDMEGILSRRIRDEQLFVSPHESFN